MATLAQKYSWLINTIRNHGKISLKDLEQKWQNSQLNQEQTIFDRSKLNRWRTAIEEQFGLKIACEQGGDYRYYLVNPEVLEKDNINNWLLENIAVNNAIGEYRNLSDRIILDPVEKGVHFLPIIMQALENNEALKLSYRNNDDTELRTIRVEPYALRNHKNRWYILGKNSDYEFFHLYSLHNISNVSIISGDHFKIPKTFDATTFFSNFYGVEISQNLNPQKLKLRVCENIAQKFRDKPFHASQKEVGSAGGFTDFEYRLAVSTDVIRTILSFGSDVEILDDEELRFQILYQAEALKRTYDYPNDPIFGNPLLTFWPTLKGTRYEIPKIGSDFIALNIEIANVEDAGFCAISYVKIHDGKIIKEFHSPIKPTPYKFDEFASEIISKEDVENAPTLAEIWPEIKDDLEGMPLVSYVCEDLGSALDVFGVKHSEFNNIALHTAAQSKLGSKGAYLTINGACAEFGIEMTQKLNSLEKAKKYAALALKLL